MGTPVYPDFLRQIFNVILAEHDINSRTANESKKLVWEAENKYHFSSFDNPNPLENLKKYFESDDFAQVLKLLHKKKEVLQDLLERIRKYYGDDLAEIVRRQIERIEKVSQ